MTLSPAHPGAQRSSANQPCAEMAALRRGPLRGELLSEQEGGTGWLGADSEQENHEGSGSGGRAVGEAGTGG